jgi:hypothetical protein
MQSYQIKTHNDGIWISTAREKSIVEKLNQQLIDNGFVARVQNTNNYGYPYIYSRDHLQVNCRLVDSVFITDPLTWSNESAVIITDNYPTRSVPGHIISVLPEFWSIWHFDPVYQDRPAVKAYNCFMNRNRGDRSTVFYELLKRNILRLGLVSYNCTKEQYEQEFITAELQRYSDQHRVGQELIPYNTAEVHGTLEQCIIDSKVSLILETYASDSHIVFSEKLFRCLQMPRPWLLYCSPGSIELLQAHGFDVLSNYTDIAYDKIGEHGARLSNILDQLETFIDREYSAADYQRFQQAAQHNQQLLLNFGQQWPMKFDNILEKIKAL